MSDFFPIFIEFELQTFVNWATDYCGRRILTEASSVVYWCIMTCTFSVVKHFQWWIFVPLPLLHSARVRQCCGDWEGPVPPTSGTPLSWVYWSAQILVITAMKTINNNPMKNVILF